MIDMRITADSPEEFHATLLAILAGTAMAAGAAPATGSRGGGRKKAEDKPEPPTAEPEKPDEPDEKSPTADGPVTKETLSPRVLALGQKSGPAAVQELFGEFGAAKFSEITEDKYPALNARLDQLLA